MEKRSRRRIRDLVAHPASQGLDANENRCARISMMARSANAPLKGRIQKRKTNNLQIITSGLQRTAGPYRCANALRSPLTTSGKKLHFQPEELSASIPASAHSTHCSSVAPATPSAPSTWPARMIGRPPGRLINETPSPMTVAVRKCLEASIDSSPLGRPDVPDANAFPYDAP